MSENDEPVAQEDAQLIVDKTIEYCWLIDTLDLDELHRIFTPDATFIIGEEVIQGLPAIQERIGKSLNRLDLSQHIISNHQVKIDKNSATSRCYLHAQHLDKNAQKGALFVIAGRYEDQFVRTENGWRIKQRDLTPMWMDGNPGVLGRD
tara:strand:- start:948 stop:1394 length:447 start_codon:yes stop_codon:yes gene_type:complete